jgi:flagellin
MAEIAISAGMRASLLSLQKTSSLLSTTQSRLATGKKVNSAIDNPTNFFAAANLNDRADQLSSRLDGMGQAVSTLKAADNSITSMRGIVSALKGVVDEALGTSDSADRATLGKQYNELLLQLNSFAKDANYKGVNLLRSEQSDVTNGGNEELKVQFAEDFDDSTLNIQGVNISGNTGMAIDSSGEITAASAMSSATTSFAVSFNEEGVASNTASVIGLRSAEVGGGGTGGADVSELNWIDNANYSTTLQSAVSELEAFDAALVNTAKSLSQNVNIVSLRQDFTSNLVSTLEEGADKLTLADLNAEGANLLALQTSQTLGIQSLALASQSNQAVLSLVG